MTEYKPTLIRAPIVMHNTDYDITIINLNQHTFTFEIYMAVQTFTGRGDNVTTTNQQFCFQTGHRNSLVSIWCVPQSQFGGSCDKSLVWLKSLTKMLNGTKPSASFNVGPRGFISHISSTLRKCCRNVPMFRLMKEKHNGNGRLHHFQNVPDFTILATKRNHLK